jgi:hypothetical protein
MDANPYELANMPSPQQQQAMQQSLQEQAMMTQPDQGNLMQGVAQQNADLVKWQLDQEDILTKIENLLRGNVWTGHGWEKKGKQLMNDRGIRTFITQLSGFCHKGIITSIYSKEEIDARMKVVHRTVTDIIYLNWEEFAIDQNDAKLIWDIIVLGQIEPMYRRATNGKYLQFLGTTQKRIESISQASNPQRASTGLFGWMGRR